MFVTFESHFNKIIKKETSNASCQTADYVPVEINYYKEKLIKFNSLKFKLENDIKWLEK